jgi:hypothetical protein
MQALLDSGAARSSVVRRSDMTGSGERTAGRGAFGATRARELADLPVQIADRDLEIVSVELVPPGHPGHGDLVGQDVLSRFRCEYRIGDGTLVLDGEGVTGGEEVFLDKRAHVYVEARWPSGETARGILDTGAAVTVADSSFARRTPTSSSPTVSAQAWTPPGRRSTAMMLMAPMTPGVPVRVRPGGGGRPVASERRP